MDLSLPRFDGREAMRRLKANKNTPHIPIIAITGRVDGGSGAAAIDAGCDAFVLKPCLPDHLLREIRALVGRCGQARRA